VFYYIIPNYYIIIPLEHCNLDGLQESDQLKRADLILTNAEKLGCKRFIKPRDIVAGNQRLNLSFTAQLFNAWPGFIFDVWC
jgi:hypothetical protein